MTADPRATGKDLLGRDLSAEERRLLDAYEQLRELLTLDLPPTANAAVRDAVATLWQAVNNLALTDERPDV